MRLFAAAVVLVAATALACSGHPGPAGPASGVTGAPETPAATPRPALDVEVRLPSDLSFAANPDAPAPVLFRHETHVDSTTPRCTGCHPGTFAILKRGGPVTHADMEAGRSCGACHDGKAAFSAADSDACEFCHQPPADAGGPAAGSAGGRP